MGAETTLRARDVDLSLLTRDPGRAKMTLLLAPLGILVYYHPDTP
jgi:hypothetical protein